MGQTGLTETESQCCRLQAPFTYSILIQSYFCDLDEPGTRSMSGMGQLVWDDIKFLDIQWDTLISISPAQIPVKSKEIDGIYIELI